MAESLIIYLGAPDDTVLWHRAGTHASGSLDDALAASSEEEITLVVPGESVLLTQVALPPIRQRARRLQAARYALEEQLAAPLDSQHIALGGNSSDGRHTAAVVSRSELEDWLERLGQARAQVRAIIPDYLCLETPEPDCVHVGLFSGRALVRGGPDQGFACEQALLPALLRAAGLQQHTLVVTGDTQGAPELLEEAGFTLRLDERPNALEILLARAPAAELNLCQGEYAPASQMNEWWRPLRATAALFAAWLILALGAQVTAYFQLRHQYNQLHAQALQEFRTAFPQVKNINDIRVQAEQQMQRLRGSDAGGGLFALLQATTTAAGNDDALTMQSLQLRKGQLFLSLHGKNIQALERLRSGFASQRGVKLTVENADAASNGVEIRARVSTVHAS